MPFSPLVPVAVNMWALLLQGTSDTSGPVMHAQRAVTGLRHCLLMGPAREIVLRELKQTEPVQAVLTSTRVWEEMQVLG